MTTENFRRRYFSTEFGPILIDYSEDVFEHRRTCLVTFHDVGFNHRSNFQDLFQHSSMKPILKHFSIVHLNAPGQEDDCIEGVKSIRIYPSFDELVEQIHRILWKHFKIDNFIGFGVGAGANLLIRYSLRFRTMVQGLFLINPIYDVGNWFEMFQIRFLCLALRYRNRFIKNLFSKRFPSIRWNSSQSPPPPPPSSSSSFCSNSSSFSSSSSSTSLENVEDEAALVVTDITNLDDGNNNNNLIYNTNNDEDEDGDYDGSSNDSNSVPDDYYFDRENDNDCEEHGNYGDNLNRNGDASIKINQKDCKKIKKFRMENFLKFLHTYANRSPLSFGSNRYDPKQTLQCSTLIIVGDRSWNDLDSQRLQEKLRPGCYEFVRISKANFVWIDCPRTLAYLFQLFIQGFGLGVNLPLPIVYH